MYLYNMLKVTNKHTDINKMNVRDIVKKNH